MSSFHHDLWHFLELVRKYFYDAFRIIINKHAPLHKFRVKGRNNPWFSPELSSLQARDDAWAKARKSKSQDDWLIFKQLRNCFTSLVKLSDFYVDKTTCNLNDPKKFGK